MAKAKSEKSKSKVPDRSEREMFPAVCSNCGKDCEVPFRPVGDKPVYCPECFQKIRALKGQQNNKPQNNQHNHNQQQNQQRQQQGNFPSNQDLLNRINSLNSKIERIIDHLGINQATKEQTAQAPKPVATAVAVEEKPAKKSTKATAAKKSAAKKPAAKTAKKAAAKKPAKKSAK
jgi:CxxC-x17-CxxC domain-containing protein